MIFGRKIKMRSTEYLNCTGTSYLGVIEHLGFRKLIFEGLEKYGVYFGGSRRGNLVPDIYDLAEDTLCSMTGQEACVTCSSGTLAGLLVCQMLEAESTCFVQREAHPAIRPLFATEFIDFSSLQSLVEGVTGDSISVFINSVDPIRGTITDFSFLENLQADLITLVVDDSHGLGILGDHGEGISPVLQNYNDIEIIVISSLGKALGIPGGVIFSNPERIEWITRLSSFGGSAPASAAYLHAMVNAREIYLESLWTLRQNMMRFASSVPTASEILPIFPVATEAFPFFRNHNILLSHLRYPSQENELSARVILSAYHTPEDIDQLVRTWLEFTQQELF